MKKFIKSIAILLVLQCIISMTINVQAASSVQHLTQERSTEDSNSFVIEQNTEWNDKSVTGDVYIPLNVTLTTNGTTVIEGDVYIWGTLNNLSNLTVKGTVNCLYYKMGGITLSAGNYSYGILKSSGRLSAKSLNVRDNYLSRPIPYPKPEVTEAPTVKPTKTPATAAPTVKPTETPATTAPTVKPTKTPATETPATAAPATEAPATEAPTVKPTKTPATETPATEAPTVKPTKTPATEVPTVKPTKVPVTAKPTVKPATPKPTLKPTVKPTVKPTIKPAVKVSITKTTVSSIGNKVYTGKPITPSITVKYGRNTLKKGTDYTVSYKNNSKTGKATVTIKGKGKYTGTKTVSFKIVPKKVANLKASTKKVKTVTLAYKKDTGASGYEISYKTSKNGKYKVAGYTSKTSYTITKLNSKKTVYIRVRAYKTIDHKKVYGGYSTVKSIKVK